MEQYRFTVPSVDSDRKCHEMPFDIKFQGSTENKLNVFAENDSYTTTFRGRPLDGLKVDTKDHVLLELQEQQETLKLKTVQALDHYIIYKHGEKPQQQHYIAQLLEMAESIS